MAKKPSSADDADLSDIAKKYMSILRKYENQNDADSGSAAAGRH